MVVDSAARFRVKKGESFAMIVWSNVAILLVGRIRVQYDNGQQDDFRLNEITTSSDRSTNFTNCGQHLAKYDGYVTSCRVGSQSPIDPQRGQIYMQLIQVSDPNVSSSVVTVLSCGYIVAGHTPALGEFVEPGPAGGHGAIRTITGTNPAAGVECNDPVPVGAMWRLRAWTAVLVNAVAAFSRFPNLIVDDGTTANRQGVAFSQTPSLTGATRTFVFGDGNDQNTTAAGQVADTDNLIVSNNGFKSLVGPFPSGYRIRTSTTGLQAADDYAAPILLVEEWVMPN